MRILVAEDDPVALEALTGLLSKWGYEVFAARDGEEAEMLLLAADAPVVAILDWVMPKRSGLDVCRALRARGNGSPYVILITAKKDRKDVQTAFEAGVDDFVAKPVDPPELRARLKAAERIVTLQARLHDRAQDAIQRAKEDWEKTFDVVPDAIMLIDLECGVSRVNWAMARLLGMHPRDCVGRKCYELFHGTAEPPSHCPHRLLLNDAQEHTVDLREDRLGKDFLVSVSPLRDGEGRLVGAVHVARDITERKRADAVVRESTERLQRTLVAAHTVAWELDLVSGALREDGPVAEFFGRPDGFQYGNDDTFFESIHPDDRAHVRTQVQRTIQDKTGDYAVEFRVILPGGGIRWVATTGRIAHDAAGRPICLRGVSSDISARKQMEVALQTSEARYRELVENTTDIVYSADAEGRLTYISPAIANYGWDAKAILSRSFLDFVVPEDRERVMADFAKLISVGEEIPTVFRAQDAHGQAIWMEARSKTLKDAAGHTLGVSGVLRNVTERELARQALEKLNRELDRKVAERTQELMAATHAAETANRAKSDFLANMSHELRTPLNAVIGFSEALEESYFGDLNEKQTRYVKFIQEGGRHLLALINDILDLSKVEAGKMDMEWGPVQVRDLLENSLIMVKEKCLTHRIALTLNVASDISDRVITADARKLKQIVFNLLSNSAKFTPDGGSITVGAQLVDGTLPRDTIEVSVVDTGVGVPSELVETVFDPFYQVKGGSRDKSSGTGLGLSLTRRLVELHDGKIWMTSPSTPLRAGEASQNPGCRVTFRLPVEAKQAITGTSEPRQAPMKRFSIATCPEDGTTAGELLRNARKRQE